ncbi:hypothetical protein [Psychromonas sp. SP041]|uniref:hypothetical protein n=1 Tax=Psychromonas sp. SP041 TaxID=1365007 RepID=UPI000409D42C|nr:hypothetical protein [Psychromonas sp. SP041]
MQLTIDITLLVIFIVVIADSKIVIVVNANTAISYVAVNNIVSIVLVLITMSNVT